MDNQYNILINHWISTAMYNLWKNKIYIYCILVFYIIYIYLISVASKIKICQKAQLSTPHFIWSYLQQVVSESHTLLWLQHLQPASSSWPQLWAPNGPCEHVLMLASLPAHTISSSHIGSTPPVQEDRYIP